MKKRPIILTMLLFFGIIIKSHLLFSSEKDLYYSSANQQQSDTIVDLSKPGIKLRVALGPGHWVSDRFRTTATFGKDWGMGVCFHPGLDYLQILGRFDYSFIRTTDGEITYADLNHKFIGFSSLSIALCQSVRLPNSNELSASYFVGGVLVSVQDYLNTVGILSGFGIEYIIRKSSWENFGVGISMNMRYQTYDLSGNNDWQSFISNDRRHLEIDLNYNLGVVIVF
ncbi:MAG: hypothetical protein PHT69_15030 [Bacteroidales bacterium]|nr:hypothetical protein [Bacteroidales bacterium]